MLSHLSEGSWVGIGLILILIITTYLGLWAAWKRKGVNPKVEILRKSLQNIRSPWHQEDKQLEELSNLVSNYKDTSTEPENDQNNL